MSGESKLERAAVGSLIVMAVALLGLAFVMGVMLVVHDGEDRRIKQQEADAMTEAARSGRLVVTAPRDSK